MKVLVTGANGFLGSHVVERLLADGHELRLLLRSTSKLEFIEGLDYERAEGDMRHPEALERSVAGVEAVVHCAGLVAARSEAEFRAVNDEGTRILAEAAAKAGVDRFVYISSLAAQGPSPDGSFYDAMEVPAKPKTPYGRSKLAGEEHVLRLRHEMVVASIRCPVIYGPRDRALLPFYRFVKMRLMPLYGDGQNQISWVHVEDAASAIASAMTSAPSGHIYTISDGGRHTWVKLATMLGDALGRQPVKLRVPGSLFAVGGLAGSAASTLLRKPLPLHRHRVGEFAQQYWVCGHERITRETGWEPRIAPDDGIRMTTAWYRERGWV